MEVKRTIKQFVRGTLASAGLEVHRKKPDVPKDMDTKFVPTWELAKPFTMTPVTRGYALFSAINHIVDSKISGCVIECGVWRGGSSMVAARTLLDRGETRDFYLFDTYAGMSEPTEHDVRSTGEVAAGKWSELQTDDVNQWCYASVDDVKANMARTGYPDDKIQYVVGKVEDTLPKTTIGDIAILRLDTDWYESTRVELELLYPKLVSGGVLILDDYGVWDGARKAVDDYFDALDSKPLLFRVDDSCRVAVKV